ncbi:cbb3-type cytochrome oxidase subunit 3 [Spongorhabdus nitratireducens]
MDINTLRGLATVLAAIAFIGVSLWAYSSHRKTAFNEAANLPFADDDLAEGITHSKQEKNNNE